MGSGVPLHDLTTSRVTSHHHAVDVGELAGTLDPAQELVDDPVGARAGTPVPAHVPLAPAGVPVHDAAAGGLAEVRCDHQGRAGNPALRGRVLHVTRVVTGVVAASVRHQDDTPPLRLDPHARVEAAVRAVLHLHATDLDGLHGGRGVGGGGLQSHCQRGEENDRRGGGCSWQASASRGPQAASETRDEDRDERHQPFLSLVKHGSPRASAPGRASPKEGSAWLEPVLNAYVARRLTYPDGLLAPRATRGLTWAFPATDMARSGRAED